MVGIFAWSRIEHLGISPDVSMEKYPPVIRIDMLSGCGTGAHLNGDTNFK
jgi:hypothetical protein